jgi:hypothetical protein
MLRSKKEPQGSGDLFRAWLDQIIWTEPMPPEPHRLVTDIDAALE